MAKRLNKKDDWNNPFDDGEEPGGLPTDVSHEAMFETFAGMKLITPANQKHIQVKYLSIDEIYPDPTQPRRVVPAVVRGDIQVLPGTIDVLLRRWLGAVNAIRSDRDGAEFDLHAYLSSGDSERHEAVVEALTGDPSLAPGEAGEFENPIERSFMRVVDLAASIRQQGLLNPITVAPRGEGYRIETGERRWLAVHLLRWHFGDKDRTPQGDELKWDKIAARIMDDHNVWRQAVENNVRDDLNAISKARQLALLLMHLHGIENFRSIDFFAHEQDFYAQVADGREYRIPRGKGELLANALNLKNTQQLRDYRALLRLDTSIWEQADDSDWSEYTIYSYIRDDSVSIDTVYEEEGDSVSIDTLSEDQDDMPGYDTMPAEIQRLYKKYTPRRWSRMSGEERRDVIDHLRVLVMQLEELGIE